MTRMSRMAPRFEVLSVVTKVDSVSFKAGDGVGVVTKPGLPIGVGEPAINPVPREMMRAAIAEVAAEQDSSIGVEVEISIANGEELATRTWNPRLGIVGGLSVLGTTGIVVPYSCAAWIKSIHSGIDVANALGLTMWRAVRALRQRRLFRTGTSSTMLPCWTWATLRAGC